MKIGLYTASFFSNVNTEDCFACLKDFKAPVCEVFLSSFSEYEGKIADKIVQNKSVDVQSIDTFTKLFYH